MLRSPDRVIDAATRLGELDRLGRAIRDRAAEPFNHALAAPTLFVNLHPEDLQDPHLVDPTSALAKRAKHVVLEVTERASLRNLEMVRAKVSELREMGFRIAIDDLGAGYAGLTSFALLEPEIVKLDMTLIRDIDSSPMKRKLVASMTTLCKEMGMLVVAEGVETAAERDTTIDLGCDLLQGYHFARPGRPFPAIECDWAQSPPHARDGVHAR